MALTVEEKRKRKYALNRKYRASHLLKVQQQEKRSRDRYRDNQGHDSMLAYSRKYQAENRIHLNALSLKRLLKNTADLADSYVKYTLTKNTPLRAKDIPQELVEFKRQQILLHRTIKEIQKCKT